MSETDPSLDARIWAYVRGEGSHAERKTLEAEIGASREAARRYSSIKLTHQRQTAHLEDEKELSKQPKSPSTHAPIKAQNDKAKSTELRDQTGTAQRNHSGTTILVVAILLLVASGGAYLVRTNWNAETLLIIRDYLHAFAAIVGCVMFLFASRIRLWKLLIAMICIAVSCGLAAMLAA